MASVWFLVTVLVAVQEVLGNSKCSQGEQNLKTCDECIRCAGKWCSEPGNTACKFQPEDSWCPNHREDFDWTQIQQKGGNVKTLPGNKISIKYEEKLVVIGSSTSVTLSYPAKSKLEVNIEIVNSTQNHDIEFRIDGHICSSTIDECTVTIHARPRTSFCSATGTFQEHVYANIVIGDIDEVITVKYHVPCACSCSKEVDFYSTQCSGHGNFSCGTCSCNEGWTRENCMCPVNRGDITCEPPTADLPNCSGNGKCGPCDICICDTEKPGHQYLHERDTCMDLCMHVTYSTDGPEQIYNGSLGLYGETTFLSVQKYNVSLLDERDCANRTKWIECTDKLNDCALTYVAKREDDGVIYAMVVKSCNDVDAGAIVAAPTVSILLAVLGVLAVIATVAGVLYWKHMNAIPPVPLNDPGYTNIDAEDCIGENPLYKPPTSSFKNPTYGKW